eukprot:1181108-Prorocentrum_minimum.AAC.3
MFHCTIKQRYTANRLTIRTGTWLRPDNSGDARVNSSGAGTGGVNSGTNGEFRQWRGTDGVNSGTAGVNLGTAGYVRTSNQYWRGVHLHGREGVADARGVVGFVIAADDLR